MVQASTLRTLAGIQNHEWQNMFYMFKKIFCNLWWSVCCKTNV